MNVQRMFHMDRPVIGVVSQPYFISFDSAARFDKKTNSWKQDESGLVTLQYHFLRQHGSYEFLTLKTRTKCG